MNFLRGALAHSAANAKALQRFPKRVKMNNATEPILPLDAGTFQITAQNVVGRPADLDEEDLARNERTLLTEGRLVSVYSSASHVRFYVITECAGSATTILLPHEY
jgi:hypothetical protein